MLNNPLVIDGLIPSKIETYDSYRAGEVTTLTFEAEDLHICYGVNQSGLVWDYCYIDRGTGEYFIDQDVASDAVLERGKKDLMFLKGKKSFK